MDQEIQEICRTLYSVMNGAERCTMEAIVGFGFATFRVVDSSRQNELRDLTISMEQRRSVSKNLVSISKIIGCDREGIYKVLTLILESTGQFDISIDHDPEIDEETGLPFRRLGTRV